MFTKKPGDQFKVIICLPGYADFHWIRRAATHNCVPEAMKIYS